MTACETTVDRKVQFQKIREIMLKQLQAHHQMFVLMESLLADSIKASGAELTPASWEELFGDHMPWQFPTKSRRKLSKHQIRQAQIRSYRALKAQLCDMQRILEDVEVV